MKLVRFGEKGQEKPGVLMEDGSIIDVSTHISDFDADFLREDGLERLHIWLREYGDMVPRVEEEVRLGMPIANPSKILCIGLNFLDHCMELNDPIPNEPVLFTKAVSALTGPDDPMELPPGSTHTDWEVELAFVIKQQAKNVKEHEAFHYVAGYTIMNDVSERDFQKNHDGQWVKGKSYDTFAPLGPMLVTPNEVDDVYQLKMVTKVNDVLMQDGSTANMIFKIPHLVSYLSRFMTLMPGDVISTGTPPGVGAGKQPPQFLREGDVVEMEIEGLGTQRHAVISA